MLKLIVIPFELLRASHGMAHVVCMILTNDTDVLAIRAHVR